MNESLPANVIEKRNLRDRIAVFRKREHAAARGRGKKDY
jgi:hypothetical protein